MRVFRLGLSYLALMGLVACSTGGGSSPVVSLSTYGGVGSGTPSPTQVLGYLNEATALANALSSGSILPGRPSTATASYAGISTVNFASGTVATGNLSMDANFTNGTVTGSTGDYLIVVPASMGGGTVAASGTLPITNGNITGSVVTATMNGNLTTGAGTYGVTSNLSGTFANNGTQSVVVGVTTGNVVLPDTSSSAISSGAFMGVQN